MHLELIDSLRCPAAHEESWLVASVESREGTHVASGVLGCPICRAEYPIVNGVIDFTRVGAEPLRVSLPGGAGAGRGAGHADVLRLAALLDLREPGGIILLAGRYAATAPWLETITAAHYVVVARPDEPIPAEAATALIVSGRLPIATGAVRAAAFDERVAQESVRGELTRVLRPDGRLVAPAAIPVPAGIRELARDEREWVGAAEGDAATAPVPLRRR